ncbi:hypothetical protein ABZ650_16550 [Streptomyces griseoviridis]|uniref:tetratricopeptide repeat protein n=1 Tax=Streptomyces griseoviridis TaxID=45398 RepID=UPI0033C45AD2
MHLPRSTSPSAGSDQDRSGRSRRTRRTLVVLGLGTAMFTAGALGLAPGPGGSTPDASTRPSPARAEAGSVAALQEHVRRLPQDAPGWAALGMAYVQQARVTADPATYRRAEQALRVSLEREPKGNTDAETGMGALEAARHDFGASLSWARRAVSEAPYSALAHGVLADAYTQLGRYDEAFAAVQRMSDLKPDAPALARASYTFELRGDTGQATALMERSLDASGTPGERAFARAHLSLLATESGRPGTGLRQADRGLAELPGDAALLEARGRAHQGLGHSARALDDYTAAVAVAPLPGRLLALGELRESLGDTRAARQQYAVLRAQDQVRRAGRRPADVDEILFASDHGRPADAVALGRQAVRARPFLAVHDAYGWALHRAGRDREALAEADLALALGTRSALFLYHRGMIHQALGEPAAARADLGTALRLDPRFHPLHAPRARAALTRIDATP